MVSQLLHGELRTNSSQCRAVRLAISSSRNRANGEEYSGYHKTGQQLRKLSDNFRRRFHEFSVVVRSWTNKRAVLLALVVLFNIWCLKENDQHGARGLA